jgi:predicted transposase YdaD
MDNKYIEQKQKEIMLYFNMVATVEQRKKFIKLILEAVWLGGKVEGVQEAREVLR